MPKIWVPTNKSLYNSITVMALPSAKKYLIKVKDFISLYFCEDI